MIGWRGINRSFFFLLSSLIGCSGPAKADDETDRALVSYRVFFFYSIFITEFGYRVWRDD